MKSTIWFIHGAGASPRSFKYLQSKLVHHYEPQMITYDHTESVASIVESLSAQASLDDKPITIIGHSLGGLIATALAQHPNVSKIVTLSAPLGGLNIAGLMCLFSTERLFRDLAPYGSTVRNIAANYTGDVPHLAFVTTHSGLPAGSEENDGVVSVRSQMSLAGPLYEKIALNHFEVLLDDEVIEGINKFLED